MKSQWQFLRCSTLFETSFISLQYSSLYDFKLTQGKPFTNSVNETRNVFLTIRSLEPIYTDFLNSFNLSHANDN